MLAGHWEIALLALLALALFGGSMLPKLARTAGRTVREVQSVKREMLSLDEPPVTTPEKPASTDMSS